MYLRSGRAFFCRDTMGLSHSSVTKTLMKAFPYLKLLSDAEVNMVYQASLTMLERTGMLIDHDRAREILETAGAVVNHDAKMVFFPPELVEEKRRLLPKSITYHGRTPEYDFTLSVDGPIYSRVAGGATHYIDLQTGENRRATLADWRQLLTLIDFLPNIHCLATFHCGDVPETVADLYSLKTALESQRKCVVHNAFSVRNQQTMLEMLQVVRGSREALAERPLVHHMLSPISPLFLNYDDTAQFLLAIENGIPTDIPIMPVAGTTSPITLAGTLAQANAEFLGMMALAQSVKPGHSMPFFVDPLVADMRSALPLFGAPEIGILVAAISQLGIEVYGLPPQAIGLDCDGFSPEQSTFQKAQNTAFQVLSGGKLVIGAGVVEAVMALSPVQLVIDDEIVAIAKRWARGMEVSEDTLAVEVLHRVGPRGHFLMEDHTLKHLKTGELMRTSIFDRDNRELWKAKGSKSPTQRAREKALDIFSSHQVPALDGYVLRELDRIVASAAQELIHPV